MHRVGERKRDEKLPPPPTRLRCSTPYADTSPLLYPLRRHVSAALPPPPTRLRCLTPLLPAKDRLRGFRWPRFRSRYPVSVEKTRIESGQRQRQGQSRKVSQRQDWHLTSSFCTKW
jgi:hypothetical protein